ncbi:hypothetical protein SESBI_04102 [Sesbania bispinosa]|nr:hypothetical protein SESBI_04102 [Sesbania bispinosa]
MENNMERVIKTMETLSKHFLNSRQQKISTFDSPRNLFLALGNDNNMTPTIDRRPKDDTERILQKLCEGEDSVQPMQPIQHSGSVKKLFTTPLSGKSSNTILMTTTTSSGYYLNFGPNKLNADGLIGPNVPQKRGHSCNTT